MKLLHITTFQKVHQGKSSRGILVKFAPILAHTTDDFKIQA